MKTKITGLLTFLIGTFFFYSCDTDVEALEIQKLKTYDEQYFENLRAFKKSDHEISYAYYEAWSPIEGVTGYKDPASWGERMVGLPDSIDIVNLWMGIPTSRDTSDSICGYAILPAEIGYTFCHACRCFSLQTPVYR